MFGPFATMSRLTPIHQVSPLYCRTQPAHQCPQRRQRQCVTEGTAMAPWNGPKNENIPQSAPSHDAQIPSMNRPKSMQLAADAPEYIRCCSVTITAASHGRPHTARSISNRRLSMRVPCKPTPPHVFFYIAIKLSQARVQISSEARFDW